MLLLDQSSFIQQIATWMCQVPHRVQGIQQRTDRWRQQRPKLRRLQVLKSLPPQPPLTAAAVPPAPTHHPTPGPAISLSLKYLPGLPSPLASQ